MNFFDIKRLLPPYRKFQAVVRRHVLPKTGRDTTRLDIRPFKKSDTLFILGSGSSINRYTSQHWEVIRAHDSFGFNFWLYHDHVPTYYMDEVGHTKSQLFNEVLFNLQQARLEDYRHTAIFLNSTNTIPSRNPGYLDRYPFLSLPHFFTPHTREVGGTSVSDLKIRLHWLSLLGAFAQTTELWHLPHKRGSVFSLVCFAVIAGYRTIVLCGIDLVTPWYFFTTAEYQQSGLPRLPDPAIYPELLTKWPYYLIPEPGHPTSGPPAVHRSMQSWKHSVSVDQVLHALNQTILRPRGIQLFVALPSSGLYPKLPAYFS